MLKTAKMTGGRQKYLRKRLLEFLGDQLATMGLIHLYGNYRVGDNEGIWFIAPYDYHHIVKVLSFKKSVELRFWNCLFSWHNFDKTDVVAQIITEPGAPMRGADSGSKMVIKILKEDMFSKIKELAEHIEKELRIKVEVI
ncbi:MAG: hypothetical protein ABH887_02390 [bacterium]